MIALSVVLAAGLIVMWTMYSSKANELNAANVQLDDANSEIDRLERELATEKTNLINLQDQLETAKDTVAELTADLDTAQDDITQLQSELSDSKLKVADLETQVAASKARITRLETDLAAVNTELTSVKAANADMTSELKKIKSPTFFSSRTELENWLKKDDTNTKYASVGPIERSYILQIRALRDGYIISAWSKWDSTARVTWVMATAFINGEVYGIDPSTDEILLENPGLGNLPARPDQLP